MLTRYKAHLTAVRRFHVVDLGSAQHSPLLLPLLLELLPRLVDVSLLDTFPEKVSESLPCGTLRSLTFSTIFSDKELGFNINLRPSWARGTAQFSHLRRLELISTDAAHILSQMIEARAFPHVEHLKFPLPPPVNPKIARTRTNEIIRKFAAVSNLKSIDFVGSVRGGGSSGFLCPVALDAIEDWREAAQNTRRLIGVDISAITTNGSLAVCYAVPWDVINLDLKLLEDLFESCFPTDLTTSVELSDIPLRKLRTLRVWLSEWPLASFPEVKSWLIGQIEKISVDAALSADSIRELLLVASLSHSSTKTTFSFHQDSVWTDKSKALVSAAVELFSLSPLIRLISTSISKIVAHGSVFKMMWSMPPVWRHAQGLIEGVSKSGVLLRFDGEPHRIGSSIPLPLVGEILSLPTQQEMSLRKFLVATSGCASPLALAVLQNLLNGEDASLCERFLEVLAPLGATVPCMKLRSAAEFSAVFKPGRISQLCLSVFQDAQLLLLAPEVPQPLLAAGVSPHDVHDFLLSNVEKIHGSRWASEHELRFVDLLWRFVANSTELSSDTEFERACSWALDYSASIPPIHMMALHSPLSKHPQGTRAAIARVLIRRASLDAPGMLMQIIEAHHAQGLEASGPNEVLKSGLEEEHATLTVDERADFAAALYQQEAR